MDPESCCLWPLSDNIVSCSEALVQVVLCGSMGFPLEVLPPRFDNLRQLYDNVSLMDSMKAPPGPARLLLTGAAGTLGRALRDPLRSACQQLRLSDLKPMEGPWAPNESFVACDLADRDGMLGLLQGVDAVVHLGGVSVETPFDPILSANILGVFHLYESARVNGVRRIVFASSNHCTGAYPRTERLQVTDPPRPDGYYGVSKLFGEHMAQLYFDRYGIETVCLRIGSGTPQPVDRRGLSTWISLRDLAQLVLRSLTAPGVGCSIVWGVSANTAAWWDNQAPAQRVGYVPQDSSDAFAAQVLAQPLPDYERDPASATARLQGGSFLGVGPFPTFGEEREP